MLDRLERLLQRPIAPSERKLAFALAALVLCAGAALVLALSSSGEGERERGAATTRAVQAPPPPLPSDYSSPPAKSTRGEREPQSAPAIAPREARAATAAARAFLAGYLPYSYGHGGADRIRAAAPRLRRQLAATPPRVPAAVARARPRLISVRALAATGGHRVDVVAVVADGQRRYEIPLTVRVAGASSVVTAVSG
jgi:hypothetical protein